MATNELDKRTIFISRAGEDKEVAIQIAQILREAGYRTFVQDEDFGHASFMERMAEGFRYVDSGGCLIALLSSHYQGKSHCLKEARYPLVNDAANLREKLIVLRLDDCEPADLLKDIRYIDIGQILDDGAELAEIVLAAVSRSLSNSSAPSKVADAKIEKIMLFLENEDHVDHGKGILIFAGIFFALGSTIIAFDYGVSVWNRIFETTYFALFPTELVLILWSVLIAAIIVGLCSQMHQMSRTIECARLTPSQLRALRAQVAERAWKNKWLIDAVISTATRRITSGA